jgi:integrase/recombinase XerD
MSLPSHPSGLRLIYRTLCPASASPYRLVDPQGIEIASVNDFLDLQTLRNLSPRSVRAYGYDLLHFIRWWLPRPLADLNQPALLDYVRHHLDLQPRPTPQTINHHLSAVRSLYRFHFAREIPGHAHNQHFYRTRSPLGYGRSQTALAGFHVKEPRRVVVPLAAEQVARFWRGFHTFRDLCLTALMLFSGLRSHELLQLTLEDLRFSETTMRVHGKGNKERILPLSQETIEALHNYLHFERPVTNSPYLFVVLKGPRRGQPLTLVGFRALFRYHRRRSLVPEANPHRFRHTFGSDMVRAGVSLPALMHLMGHAHIRTTMIYVQLAPQDVWREYALAIQNRLHPMPSPENS